MLILQTVMRFHVHPRRWPRRLFVGQAFAAGNTQSPNNAENHILGIDPGPKHAVYIDSTDLGLSMAKVCVAKTSRTWLVPIPKANVPNAPCVLVWLSPQANVIPG